MKRKIEEILFFRNDICPFLTHLTRNHDSNHKTAKENLENIIQSGRLIQSSTEMSDVRFGGNTLGIPEKERLKFFGSISFTETPINETHCLLEIDNRRVNLEPYGFVFLKDDLIQKGVDPVIYINNSSYDKDDLNELLFSLKDTHPNEAQKLLPLIAVFGTRFTAPGAARQTTKVDFRWEREWRFPSWRGDFDLKAEEIFIGFCRDDEISHFEALSTKKFGLRIRFIDPQRNMKWYATQLIDARQRLDLKFSVV